MCIEISSYTLNSWFKDIFVPRKIVTNLLNSLIIQRLLWLCGPLLPDLRGCPYDDFKGFVTAVYNIGTSKYDSKLANPA